MLEEAQKIKKNAKAGDEISFPPGNKRKFRNDSGANRQTGHHPKNKRGRKKNQSTVNSKRQGEIIWNCPENRRWQCVRGLGRATTILPKEEQIRGERLPNRRRTRALLSPLEETHRGITLIFVPFPSEIHRQAV